MGSAPAPENRPERFERFIRRVLAGASNRKLATEFGVTERTISAWLQRPKIRKRIDAAIDASLDRYVRGVTSSACNAHTTLLRLLSDESAQVRLGAARSLLAPMERLLEFRANRPPVEPQEDKPIMSPQQVMEDLRRMLKPRG